MKGTVLITTHRLPLAGSLREAFSEESYAVDLVPDPSHLDMARDAVLLVVTGADSDVELQEWTATAQDRLGIPVFTTLPQADGEASGRGAGAEEAFGPHPEPAEIALLGHRIVQRRRLQGITGIVGESEPIREVLERIVQIGPVDSTVLITGESGTGKELVARGVHALSSRRHRAFLAVNVAALSETLLESELFGHEKGAFTGAIDSRKGFFELAHRGTLFLDEVGEMPLSTQTKLLRVLEQREFLRVGGEEPFKVDVRIITATNQELRQMVAGGRFRRDLYYRLNILAIEMPPLRERRSDIPRLIHHFVRDLQQRLERPFPGLTPEAMELLVHYDWPGNVRELRNLVESMVVLSPGRRIGREDIPREIRDPAGTRRLLPVPVRGPVGPADPGPAPGTGVAEAGPRLRPELEFVFRTLVDLRMDMDQLRGEFDRYRDEIEERLEATAGEILAFPSNRGGIAEVGARGDSSSLEGRAPDGGPDGGEVSEWGAGAEGGAAPSETSDDRLRFHSGMTIDELEAEAIRVVLREVRGNRRKAAESLGIGERTLYRKIHKYGIDG